MFTLERTRNRMCLYRYNNLILVIVSIIAISSAYNPYTDLKMDYAASSESLKLLMQHELKIIKILAKFALQNDKFSIPHTTIYLEDFRSSVLVGMTAERSTITIGNFSYVDSDYLLTEAPNHPLIAFRCIRRIVNGLAPVYEELLKFSKTDLDDIVALRSELDYPEYDDLETAFGIVIRLKKIYKLNVDDLVSGKIGKIRTGSGLTARHCFEIALYSTQLNYYSEAIDFYDKALRMPADKNLPFTKEEIKIMNKKLDELMRIHDEKLNSQLAEEDFRHDSMPYFFDRILEGRNSSEFKRRKPIRLEPTMEDMDTPTAIAYRFERLCRGENLKSKETNANLKCYLNSDKHPAWVISPLKIEVHHEIPLVLQIYDVFTKSEMEDIKSEVKYELRRSRTVTLDSTKGEVNPFRTSSNSWLNDFRDEQFAYINKRVGKMVGLDTSKIMGTENVQIANYASGGHYVAHTDAIFEKEVLSSLDPESEELVRGDRIATFMAYLSEVEAGGYTVFPRLKIGVKPVVGSAVFWYNLFSDGSINSGMLHAACPVLFGHKWVANKWIRSNEQLFVKKCPLTRKGDKIHLKF